MRNTHSPRKKFVLASQIHPIARDDSAGNNKSQVGNTLLPGGYFLSDRYAFDRGELPRSRNGENNRVLQDRQYSISHTFYVEYSCIHQYEQIAG